MLQPKCHPDSGQSLAVGVRKELRIKKGLPIFPGIFLLSWRCGVEVRSGVQPPRGISGEGEAERIGGCDQGGGCSTPPLPVPRCARPGFFMPRLPPPSCAWASPAGMKKPQAWAWGGVGWRSEADSNRCSSFCRAEPSHSAIGPAVWVCKYTQTIHQGCKAEPLKSNLAA